jgi:hypothetical protein
MHPPDEEAQYTIRVHQPLSARRSKIGIRPKLRLSLAADAFGAVGRH